MKNSSTAPTLAILLAVGLWGGSFAAAKTAVAALPPMTVMWLRMAFACLALLPFLRRIRFSGYQRGDWLPLAGMLTLMPCIYFLLESNALRYTTSGQAGIISATVPLLVALGAWLTLGEALNLRALSGLLPAMAGVAVLSVTGRAGDNAPNPILGNLLEFGAMCAAAGYMLILKRLSSRCDPWALTAMQTLAGFLFFLPGALPLVENGLPRLDAAAWASLAYLGAGVSLGAFGLYNWGISRMEASKSSAYINLVPVVAAALGWAILDEALTPTQCLAATAVLVGVRLSQARKPRPDTPAPSLASE